MINDFSNGFQPINDRQLRNSIRKYFHYCLNDKRPNCNATITLTHTKWFSANALNHILIFHSAIRIYRPSLQVYINLFPKEITDSIVNCEVIDDQIVVRNSEITHNDIQLVKQKIIFYNVIGLLTELSGYSSKELTVYPDAMILSAIQEKLKAIPFQDDYEKYYQHSSRILGLTKLIETQLEQRKLSDSVVTMASILRENLKGRVIGSDELTGKEKEYDAKLALDEGKQIMFELVKNIYQHSEVVKRSGFNYSGYACVQLLQYPMLDTPKINMMLIKDLIVSKRFKRAGRWQFLNITINDFGVGLVNKVRAAVMDELNLRGQFKIGRLPIDYDFAKSDFNLILLAATTDYTSKKVSSEEERFLDHRLASKGLGFLFCMGFIAKFLGRMEIRSGRTKALIIARPSAMFANFWENAERVAVTLENDFDQYYQSIEFELEKEEESFPGTQLIIEVPIERRG